MKLHPPFSALTIIVLCSILYRILPHPPNFTPIAALGLCLGATCHNKYQALVVTVLSMFVADCYLGLYSSLIFTYLGLCSVVYLGIALPPKPSATRLVIHGLTGSIVFFMISNFGVWLLTGMYAHTPTGFFLCYQSAVPFLQYDVLSMLLFGFIFFAILHTIAAKPKPLIVLTL